MKTALAIFVYVLICCTACYAQPKKNEKRDDGLCVDDDCINQKFPYYFCSPEGGVVVKCSSNPNNEHGLKLLKMKMPVEFEYVAWTLAPDVTGDDGVIKFYQGFDTNFVGYPVFSTSSMPSILEAAAARWSSICPQQGPDAEYQPCRVQIRWSRDDREFGSHDVTKLHALTRIEYNLQTGCALDCPSSYIVLNQQPSFLNVDKYGRPRFFFSTERENGNFLPRPPAYHYLDAYTAMLHEFGHWFGFPHSNTEDSFKERCDGPDGIMKPFFGSLEQGDLSLMDICQFLKAYCCKKTQTIVEVPTTPCPDCPPEDHTKPNTNGNTDARSDIGFTAMPNPALNGVVNVSIYGAFTTGSASIRVADANGNIVLSQQIHDAANAREISVDVSSLPIGVYMVQLLDGDKTFARKIIVSER